MPAACSKFAGPSSKLLRKDPSSMLRYPQPLSQDGEKIPIFEQILCDGDHKLRLTRVGRVILLDVNILRLLLPCYGGPRLITVVTLGHANRGHGLGALFFSTEKKR